MVFYTHSYRNLRDRQLSFWTFVGLSSDLFILHPIRMLLCHLSSFYLLNIGVCCTYLEYYPRYFGLSSSKTIWTIKANLCHDLVRLYLLYHKRICLYKPSINFFCINHCFLTMSLRSMNLTIPPGPLSYPNHLS